MEQVTWEKAQMLFTDKQNYFVMFTTSWCPDCKMMKLGLKNVIAKFNNKPIKFIEIDAEQANLFRKNKNGWQILKVPAFFIVKNNEHQFIGYEYVPIPIIEKAITSAVQ